jgi:hypothetical protein
MEDFVKTWKYHHCLSNFFHWHQRIWALEPKIYNFNSHLHFTLEFLLSKMELIVSFPSTAVLGGLRMAKGLRTAWITDAPPHRNVLIFLVASPHLVKKFVIFSQTKNVKAYLGHSHFAFLR